VIQFTGFSGYQGFQLPAMSGRSVGQVTMAKVDLHSIDEQTFLGTKPVMGAFCCGRSAAAAAIGRFRSA